jgi:molybdate transport system substrate-binding protein
LRGALACLLLASPWTAAREVESPTVYAAASLTEVMEAIGARWAAKGNPTPRLVFASSALLARQIEAGARADLYVSADEVWMDHLQAKGLVAAGSRRTLAGNRLVLVAPAAAAGELRITQGFALAAALGSGRLALGDPELVPAGKYARAALEALDAWAPVAQKLIPTDNVRVALALVARGEAGLGIVYATDARVEPRVRVLDRFPPESHPPIRYPAALLDGASPAAAALLDFLHGIEGQQAFRDAGFTDATGGLR